MKESGKRAKDAKSEVRETLSLMGEDSPQVVTGEAKKRGRPPKNKPLVEKVCFSAPPNFLKWLKKKQVEMITQVGRPLNFSEFLVLRLGAGEFKEEE